MRIAVTNEKGGVGKTTTAVNLAACLGSLGRRVLLIDLDAQANCTSHTGVDVSREDEALLQVFTADREMASVIVPDVFPGVDLVPSSPMLAGAPAHLATRRTGADRVLLKALKGIREPYDFVIMDCPPTLGILTINALTVADRVIVPVEPAAFSLDGLAEVLATIDEVREDLNPNVQLLGVLVCRADVNTRVYRAAMQAIRQAVPGRLFEAIVPRNVKLQEAAGAGIPIISLDPTSAGAEAYRRLALEVDHARG